MARRLKRLSRRAVATPTGATRPGGALESPSTPSASKSTGRKKVRTTAGQGRIFRASIEIPKGETAANRSDIEVFFDRLPEPIDLELDLKNRVLYWTDRGDPPRGNTVNRASIDAKPQAPEIVLTHLMEGIGIALDVAGRSDVCDRFCRFDLFRQARRIGRTQFSVRAGQSHRASPTPKSEIQSRRTNHVQ